MTLRRIFIMLAFASVCLFIIGATLINVTEETDDWPITRERPYTGIGVAFVMVGILLFVAIPSFYYYSVLVKASRYLDVRMATLAEGASEAPEGRTALSESKGGDVNLSAPKFCRHCGQGIPSDSAFCEHCGKQL